jgi:outer membrane immunogenic protein
MKKIVLAALGLASFAGSAVAADMAARPYVKAPPPAPVYSWTGCYLGAGGGYGMFNQDTDITTSPGGVLVTSNTTQGGRGWFGTVQGGCDYQFGSVLPFLGNSMVIGAFADGNWGDIKGDIGTFGFGFTGREKLDSSWAVGARIGWLPFERLLTYFSGGYTQAHFKGVDFVASPVPGAVLNTTAAYNANGWFLGSGYEYGINWLPGLFWKTEYRYSWFDNRDISLLTPAGNPAGFTFHTKNYVQEIRSELVWRFNWGR